MYIIYIQRNLHLQCWKWFLPIFIDISSPKNNDLFELDWPVSYKSKKVPSDPDVQLAQATCTYDAFPIKIMEKSVDLLRKKVSFLIWFQIPNEMITNSIYCLLEIVKKIKTTKLSLAANIKAEKCYHVIQYSTCICIFVYLNCSFKYISLKYYFKMLSLEKSGDINFAINMVEMILQVRDNDIYIFCISITISWIIWITKWKQFSRYTFHPEWFHWVMFVRMYMRTITAAILI